jgi:asparagine synthase (glutamine-hydrolysing)
MSGIAGTGRSGRRPQVLKMLDKIAHRGLAGREALEFDGGTLGVVWARTRADAQRELREEQCVRDQAGDGHLAEAKVRDGKLLLTRDQLGVAPLYYGQTEDGTLCFASEVKALLEIAREVHEFPQGHSYDGDRMHPCFQLQKKAPLHEPVQQMAKELRHRLNASVRKHITEDQAGAWLSGGLDSSTIATLARARVGKLYTFAAGLQGAPDLEYARETADFIGSDHREAMVDFSGLLRVLPDVIYHLESFDALLVRSSTTNYLVAQLASRYVPEVFSGEGGDELFAGYEYLKHLSPSALPDELIDIAGRLHNTALQRVDRCASAHGTVAHVPFTDPELVDYVLRIPIELKLHHGIEKWILRQAMADALPERVLKRTKAKFWEGAGIGDLLARHADREISDDEFRRERKLPNGWDLDSKEELMYFRIFQERFGDLVNLSWMGRTKGAPRQ